MPLPAEGTPGAHDRLFKRLLLAAVVLLLAVLTWERVGRDQSTTIATVGLGSPTAPGGQTPAVRDALGDESAPVPAAASTRPPPKLRVPAVLRGTDVSLWLDAQHAGSVFASASCTGKAATDEVGCWKDRSGNGLAAVQELPSFRPTVIGSPRRGLVFDASDHLRFSAGDLPTGTRASTVLVVLGADPSDPAPQNDRVAFFYGGLGSGTGRRVGGVAVTRQPFAAAQLTDRAYAGERPRSGERTTVGQFSLTVAEFSKGKVRTAVNDSSFGRPVSVAFDTEDGPALVGSDADPMGANNWRGTIAELIVVDRVLSARERTTVAAYLNQKWMMFGVRP